MKNTVLILMLMFSCCMVGQDVLVTQNLDATFVNVNGSNRCRTNSGIYFDNYFARAFDLQNDHGIDTDFKINEVDFGVRFGKDMIVYVNIYTANTTDLSDSSLMLTPVSALNTISYEFSSMLGTNIVNISQATVITIPILNPVVIPAGEILVVEVFAPNSGTATNQDFAMGSNTSGQTKPSYVKAPICFNTNFFTNASSFGADGQSYVMAVRGEPPFDYEFTSGFDNNFNTPSSFIDGAAGAAIRSLTVQADAESQEYIIQGTSADTTIHKWFNTTSPLNEEFVLNYGDASSSNSNLSNPAVINRHYTFQIQGFALPSFRNAVIMQTDNAPVEIMDLTYDANVSENQDVVVTVNLSGAKSPQEKAFIRYSKDNFATSELVEVQFPTPTSASGTATIPASFNTSGVVQLYAYTTTVNATPTSNHDLIALRIKKNGNLFYTYHINNLYQTQAGASVWSVPTSWEGNQVPPPNANVTIKHILNLTDNRQVTNLEVQDGITLNITTGDTLTIQNNGQITTTGSTGGIISGAGVVNFAQNGSILNKLSVAHVNLASAGVSFGTQCTITGSLTLNSGSFVDFNAPIYGPNSTLIYNNGGVFGRSAEWTNPNLTQGNPAHVRIQNNTTLDLGSSTNKNVPAVITGNLTIESGCALYMDYNGNNMRAPLIVEGNFVNNGAISLSDNTFDPEPNNNGNLKVFGDFTNNGTFTFNNRALIFEGNEVQNLTAAPNFPIPYLLINKTAGEVVLNQDIVINGNSGTALNMSNQGILNLNGHQLQIGDNTITYVEFLDNAALKGSTDSKILFKSTNSDSGSLKFKNEGFDNYLSEFEMDGNGAISLSDTLNILRRFVLKNGTFNSNGNLTFKSSESLTAIIPEVTDVPGVSINGDIRVERHYPMGNRAFRYVSSPVTSTAFIRDQWQEGQNNSTTTNNSNTNHGYGTHITGSQQPAANGFDATQTGNPSLFTWNNDDADPDWAPIPNTDNTTLEAGKSYALMMRGDRSTNLNSNSATGNSTVLRSWGMPILGTHTVTTNVGLGNFALIGNPYQAQVDITEVEKPGFGNFFYIWDPTIGTRGGYAAVEINGTTVTVTTTPSETTQANQFLQVGQAFFIQATAANPSMTFQESHKSDATDNLTTFSMPNYANINVNLYRNGNQMVDGLRISLSEDFDDDVDFEDAVKLWNEQEYLAIDKNQSWLMVEKRTIPENDTIRLFSGNYMANDYQLKIDIQQLDTHEVYVHDAYLNESQLVSNNQQHTYSFSVDASLPESVHPSRFSLFFNPLPLSSEMPSEANRITTYPNPVTHGELYMAWPIQSSSQSTHVEVFDVFGKKVHAQTFSSPEPVFTIKLSHLPTGMYVLKAKQEKQVYTTKIIVE